MSNDFKGELWYINFGLTEEYAELIIIMRTCSFNFISSYNLEKKINKVLYKNCI